MRRVVTVFLVLSMFLPYLQAVSARAQVSDADGAAQMAYDLSVLEAEGDFNTLYDLIHPDAHAIIPRSAVIGWYQNEFALMGVAPAVITGVQFVSWTWAVNGVTYPYTAEVSFEQVRADGTWIVDVVRLVQDQYGTWRWFFGRSQEFVAEQIERYVQPTYSPSSFDNLIDFVVEDLDLYWASSFSGGNQLYLRPGVIPFPGFVQSGCGPMDSYTSEAFYCLLDGTIYVDIGFMRAVDYQFGDFAWVTVMAHEWAHHVQLLDGTRQSTTRAHELQADCLAGSYARDAETRGILSPGDISEGIALAEAVGDPVGLPEDHPGAHGTSEERMQAFMLGYLTGFVGCGLDLSDGSGFAVGAPVQPSSSGSLMDLLPQQPDIPADLSLVSQKERTLAEVAANYTDPAATERMYRDWGWQGNVTILYAGTGTQSGVTEVYASIHQLGGRDAAGDALAVSMSDQAASTGAWEIAAASSADETRALRTNADVTLYARKGEYLIRLTVTSWLADPTPEAVSILEAILGKTD